MPLPRHWPSQLLLHSAVKTEEVRAALRREYTRQDCAIIFEVPNGMASGRNNNGRSAFCDAIVCNFWRSRGFEMEGFEIKVSRSDWQRELQMPRKAESHFERCDRWWLITPANGVPIAKPDEIPGPWGWMQVKANGDLHVAKKAPKLVPARPFDLEFAFALVRAASRFDQAAIRAEILRITTEQDGSFSERVNRRAAELAAEQTGANPEDQALLKALRQAFDGDSLRWVGAPKVIQLLQAVCRLLSQTRHNGFENMADRLLRASQAMIDAHHAVQALDGFLEGGSLPASKAPKGGQ